MDLGPNIKPGDRVMRWESSIHDVLVPATVLAVMETAILRMAFFYLPAWTEYGRDMQREEGVVGKPMLGRGHWFSSRGVSAWCVSHWRPWEGPRTLDEALAEIAEIHKATSVVKPVGVESIVAEEEARPAVLVRRK